MRIIENKAEDVKIAYIGGGSRGWAWGFMSDLASCGDMCGSVYLYDIDKEAAVHNQIIGNRIKDDPECVSEWEYKAVDTLKEAVSGADFVIISILPGTFDDMESDVHCPEKYGIYQSVGDTVGAGGVLRALRTVPMFDVIADAVRDYAPDAWVINYTNPMTVCVKALYNRFPDIKAFGCCHEVFGTQKLLAKAIEDIKGIKNIQRSDIDVNVVGINHFTWLTAANYKNTDIFPIYKEFVKKYKADGFGEKVDDNWRNKYFSSREMVKMDLFDRYGYIAAAGDRHLAEFCPGKWYLKDPDTAAKWGFGLTPVSWRKQDLAERLAKSKRLVEGEEKMEISKSGEEGVNQIRALLGLRELVTNVNIPNVGQIPNLPYGAVVETNAVFRANSLTPVFASSVPNEIYPMIVHISSNQQILASACSRRDIEKAFISFINEPNVTLGISDARKLFDEMVDNTKEYLGEYFN